MIPHCPFQLCPGSKTTRPSPVAIAFGGAMEVWHLPVWLAVAFGLLVGTACGFVNGWLTYRSGLTSFIITLATLSIFKGVSLGVTQAQPFYGIPASVKAFGSARWGPLPEHSRRCGSAQTRPSSSTLVRSTARGRSAGSRPRVD